MTHALTEGKYFKGIFEAIENQIKDNIELHAKELCKLALERIEKDMDKYINKVVADTAMMICKQFDMSRYGEEIIIRVKKEGV